MTWLGCRTHLPYTTETIRHRVMKRVIRKWHSIVLEWCPRAILLNKFSLRVRYLLKRFSNAHTISNCVTCLTIKPSFQTLLVFSKLSCLYFIVFPSFPPSPIPRFAMLFHLSHENFMLHRMQCKGGWYSCCISSWSMGLSGPSKGTLSQSKMLCSM